jgi:pyridoxal phosphate enzyme (YggS family)
MSSIAENLKSVKDRIASAAHKVGRDPAEITLVAVSKTKSASMIREAFEAGHRIFGENYAQELAAKAKELADLDISWHFIGHLQRNKARLVAPVASCVETVDSARLAEALNDRAAGPLDILIEINIGAEDSKSGVDEDELPDLFEGLKALDNLRPRGLMIIPPYIPDPEASRPHFIGLRKIMARLNEQNIVGSPLTELSMGMSHDFEAAIEEGATIIRVGTAIFGERTYER